MAIAMALAGGGCSVLVDTDGLAGGALGDALAGDVADGSPDEPLIRDDGADASGPPIFFADDFDEAGLAAWTVAQSGGSVTLDTVVSTSAPLSARIAINQNDNGSLVSAAIIHDLAAPSNVDCSASMRVDGPNGVGSIGIFNIAYGQVASLTIAIDGPTLQFGQVERYPDGGIASTNAPLTSYATDVWMRVRMKRSGDSVHVEVGGVTLFDGPALTKDVGDASPQLTLGTAGDHDRGPYVLHFDDVQCEQHF